jgi:hypothetical protein
MRGLARDWQRWHRASAARAPFRGTAPRHPAQERAPQLSAADTSKNGYCIFQRVGVMCFLLIMLLACVQAVPGRRQARWQLLDLLCAL